MKNFEKNIKLNNKEELVNNTELCEKFIWKVTPTDTPLFRKKCSKCRSSNLYRCSDKFRINSQKKTIDVWLIYRCVKCNDTCNITIVSRTRTELIDKNLFMRFSNNDKNTAWEYAFDMDIIRKNKMELDYSNIEYNIECEDIILEDIVHLRLNSVQFVVRTKLNTDLKLTSLIKKYFSLSTNQLKVGSNFSFS